MTNKSKKIELLAPAGSMKKLETALYFGADAVYVAGKKFGLRAFADNFTDEELRIAAALCKSKEKKLYVTINIFPNSDELDGIAKYGQYLKSIGVDGVIVSDLGVFSVLHSAAPNLELHVSTQANVINSAAANAWARLGAKRIVLARELTLTQIAQIRKDVSAETELEAFVHGAMCIAYSGRCLLSAYFTGRSGNRGECVQSCRWQYELREQSRDGVLGIEEDERGTYILSGKDLCMIEHLRELIDVGITSFKIEGRVKSEYYVAGITNAYRRAMDLASSEIGITPQLLAETYKVSHRSYSDGFYLGEKGGGSGDNELTATHIFTALVVGEQDGYPIVEMRNRFCKGDTLEVLSPSDSFNKEIIIQEIMTTAGEPVTVADKVQQLLVLKTDLPLRPYDILRKII